jgi:membrane fusion protein, adhesin transport system
MLNISSERISHRLATSDLHALPRVVSSRANRKIAMTGLAILAFTIICMFVPWTQTIDSVGTITTLKPEHRPQTIHSTIAGRIEHWYVQEGEFVKAGDTILHLSEIKDDYFDPQLLNRTQAQIQAKSSSVNSYEGKAAALDRQVSALSESRSIKLQQATNKLRQSKLKIESDSISWEAAKTNLKIAQDQYARMVELYKKGLKSLTDLEGRQLKLQETQAKAISDENKLLTSRNELLNAIADLRGIENEYADKIAKAQSDRFEANSGQFEAEANVMKLENQFSNYERRRDLYFVTAPQTGYITRVLRYGIGETIKEGEELVSIMPSESDFVVELYIQPRDLPLVSPGNQVRIIFDGWPALVFSGWPGASTGTFAGEVLAIDKFISPNGKYRMLIGPQKGDVAWPKALQFGSGAKGMVMLNDVPIWYELWRRINGFPPTFYDNVNPKAKAGKDDGKSKKEK